MLNPFSWPTGYILVNTAHGWFLNSKNTLLTHILLFLSQDPEEFFLQSYFLVSRYLTCAIAGGYFDTGVVCSIYNS